MNPKEGKAHARISTYGTERELFCRVLWPRIFRQAERENFLKALISELDRLMRESDESERDINKSG